jgi:protein-glutamine gamma-glutamyltransferase
LKPRAGHVVPVLCALAVAMAPHAPGLPLWIIAWCAAMWLYMLVQLKTGWPVPGPVLRHVLAFAGIIGLLATFRVQIGADAFVGLMAVMAAIKPFEMATHRHRMITVLLTYFIIITSLFRSESLWTVLYMFVSVFVTTLALVRINHPRGRFRPGIFLTARIMAQAIPLMILLFLLFPRLQQGLFSVETPGSGKSGFAEILNPGSISRMAKDPSLAFRANFDGPLPRNRGLYWRGIVFERFNGVQWHPAAFPSFIHPGPRDLSGAVTYTIVLEPHKSRWLFALDRPVAAPPGARLTTGHTLFAGRPVTRRHVYQAVSILDPSPEKGENNRIPVPVLVGPGTDNNPGTRSLARSLAEGISDPQEKLDRILAYFKENRFTYTLAPPLAGAHPVDDFVLKTRQGYCEHYAGALAFMMTVLDVPARVVGGYLGGELNPYGNYITVRQSAAHAWTEVFMPDKGWVRVDPTLVVAPERLEQNPDGSFFYSAGAGTIPVHKRVVFMLEAANLKWEAWFTGYSFAAQKALIQQLGVDTARGAWKTILVLLSLTLLVLALFFRFLMHRFYPEKKDPAAEAYTLFCKRLARIGLVRPPNQGPVDFFHQIKTRRPDLAKKARIITNLYIQIRFARSGSENQTKHQTKQLNTYVRQFKPSRTLTLRKN